MVQEAFSEVKRKKIITRSRQRGAVKRVTIQSELEFWHVKLS